MTSRFTSGGSEPHHRGTRRSLQRVDGFLVESLLNQLGGLLVLHERRRHVLLARRARPHLRKHVLDVGSGRVIRRSGVFCRRVRLLRDGSMGRCESR
jgi:hypothetical protein